MKRIALLAVVAVVALGLMPATAGAGTAPTGKVTIVHDATFSAFDPLVPFPVTLCVDGEPFAGGVGQEPFVWGDILPPVELPADTYEISIYQGAVEVCEGEPDIGPDDLLVEAGDDITAAAIWTSDGPGLTVWDNDSSCLEPISARLTVRHGARTGGPVDVVATVGGQQLTVVEGLEEGDQATLDLPAPLEATDVAVTAAGDPTTIVIEIGDLSLLPGISYVVYAGGGADGFADVFTDAILLDECVAPVEPTTPTTAPAPAAQAVAARPAFTG